MDIDSIIWLEEYLRTFRGLLIFTSHDSRFINNVASHILDIDYGEIRCYTGNFDNYMEQKEQKDE